MGRASVSGCSPRDGSATTSESWKEETMIVRRMIATGLAFAMAALLAAGPAWAAKPIPTEKVNLNTATVEQLTTLPGVGPTLAARIVEYRERAGQFGSAEELMNVKGIGEKNFEKIEEWLVVEPQPKAKKK
jgi:comEA protein